MMGAVSFCNFFGHRSSRCRHNPENKDIVNGVVKKAGESVENDGANELTRRRIGLRKKKKRGRKKLKQKPKNKLPRV